MEEIERNIAVRRERSQIGLLNSDSKSPTDNFQFPEHTVYGDNLEFTMSI